MLVSLTHICRISSDFAAGALCRLSCAQAEQARFDLLAELIQLIEGALSLMYWGIAHTAEHNDHDDNQKLEKRES